MTDDIDTAAEILQQFTAFPENVITVEHDLQPRMGDLGNDAIGLLQGPQEIAGHLLRTDRLDQDRRISLIESMAQGLDIGPVRLLSRSNSGNHMDATGADVPRDPGGFIDIAPGLIRRAGKGSATETLSHAGVQPGHRQSGLGKDLPERGKVFMPGLIMKLDRIKTMFCRQANTVEERQFGPEVSCVG